LQSQLTDLETGADTSVFLQGRIATNINALSRLANTLQNLQSQLPSSKEIWRMYKRKRNIDRKTKKHIHTSLYRRAKLEKRKCLLFYLVNVSIIVMYCFLCVLIHY
jgi:hypothetical protein